MILMVKKYNGLYIAGSEKDAGKTTLSIGIMSYLKPRLEKVAFLKPLGQKAMMVDQKSVGQDSFLMERIFALNQPDDIISPFVADSGMSYEFIFSGKTSRIKKRIFSAYSVLSAENKFVIVEGTGHPGVGSVFGLSNADVAAYFGIPALIVLPGGIGRTIDRFSLCSAIFRMAGVKIIGVVINKIIPSKMEKVRSALGEYFRKNGVPVFGYMPHTDFLSKPLFSVWARKLGAVSLAETGSVSSHIDNPVFGFGTSDSILEYLEGKENTILILASERVEVMDAILSRKISGSMLKGLKSVVLCGESCLPNHITNGAKELGIGLFHTTERPESALELLSRMTVKVEPGEKEKISRIAKMVKKHVDIEAILSELEKGLKIENSGIRTIGKILARPVGFFRKLFGD